MSVQLRLERRKEGPDADSVSFRSFPLVRSTRNEQRTYLIRRLLTLMLWMYVLSLLP